MTEETVKGGVPRGPTSARVSATLRVMRQAQRLSRRELVDRLAEVGRPTHSSAIAKMEAGRRRVDVDDLVSLALALGCTPNRLLLPAEADIRTVALTDSVSTAAREAWLWANGGTELEPGAGQWAAAFRECR